MRPILVFVLLFNSVLFAQAQNLASTPDTPAGFDHQCRAVWEALRSGRQADADQLALMFEIPSSWFVEYFGKEQAGEMERRYEKAFSTFRARALHFSTSRDPALGLQINFTTRLTDRSLDDNPVAPLLKPLPSIEHFTISLSNLPDDERKLRNDPFLVTWIESGPYSFIYVDGAFRYFGNMLFSHKTSYPFWDVALFSTWDHCSPEGKQSGGKVIRKLIPEYPSEAITKKLEDKVQIMVTVAVDGSARNAKVVQGMPVLADAAVAAAKQWRFSPFLECGTAVERRTIIHFNFDLLVGEPRVDAY